MKGYRLLPLASDCRMEVDGMPVNKRYFSLQASTDSGLSTSVSVAGMDAVACTDWQHVWTTPRTAMPRPTRSPMLPVDAPAALHRRSLVRVRSAVGPHSIGPRAERVPRSAQRNATQSLKKTVRRLISSEM